MKLRISLAAGYNGEGAIAVVEDDECSSLDIVNSRSCSAKVVCKRAAKALRDAAARFDRLANMSSPYNIETHDTVNRQKVQY